MARRNIVTGIDIGSSAVRVIVSEYMGDHAQPTIIGVGFSEARGLRNGYIVDPTEATESIREALREAQESSGLNIKRAYIAIGGISLESETAVGSVFVSRADNEVTDTDIQKAIESAEEQISSPANKQIIHAIPILFKIDGEEVLGKPVGLKGTRFEVEVLFVTCLNQHLNDFIHCTQEAGVQVSDIMASPIAASFSSLSKKQKIAGCILANIGAETLSLAVFENNIPISLKVFPIGGVAITNDIALGLKIPLEEAEEVKHGKGIHAYPKKKLEDIIEARLSDIFDLIHAHLKKIGKNGLLPAGIIITGGSSAIPVIEELAKEALSLPSKIAVPDFSKQTNGKLDDSRWAVAYGLCVMGFGEDGEDGTGIKFARRTKNSLSSWIKQYLP